MLQDEIATAQRQVRTDAYQMSIGEVVTMYRDGELVIDPDFQRLFRWDETQKSKLIESILLGIPLPPIFVFEREDGKWELVDGLQRVSTLLEFMGLLKIPGTDQLQIPSYMSATKYLPSLNKAVWEVSDRIPDLAVAHQAPLDKSQQLAIRRARLGVEILKRPSDNKTKFDLFQRLNAGGTPANPQELRNCVMIMINPNFFNSLRVMANRPSFLTVLSASEDQLERQRHLEYACRFLVHTNVNYDGNLDVEEFIDDGIVNLAPNGISGENERRFHTTFDLLHDSFGGNALKRIVAGAHQGRVGLAAFECIAIGIGRNINAINALANSGEYVARKVREFWEHPGLDRFFAPGLRGTVRLQRTIPFGEEFFRP